MPKKRQALVEYADMNGSFTAVTYAADNQVYIAGHPAFINYSTSQKISRPGDSDDSRSVNNVLLFTIMNPIYPITTVNSDIFHCMFGVLHVALKIWYLSIKLIKIVEVNSYPAIIRPLFECICLQSLIICAYMLLLFYRMFFTLSATTVGQSRELSSSGRMVSKQWLNILSLGCCL